MENLHNELLAICNGHIKIKALDLTPFHTCYET